MTAEDTSETGSVDLKKQEHSIQVDDVEPWTEDNDESLLVNAVNKPTEHYPLWRIIIIGLCMLGLELPWTFLYTYFTPTLRELGVSNWLAAYAWMFSPLFAFIFVPLIGIVSDRTNSRWGRRTPYLFVLTLILTVSMLAIPAAVPLGLYLSPATNTTAEALVVITNIFTDVTCKMYEELIGALVVSIIPVSQLTLVNSWMSGLSGVGSAAGYLVGSLPLGEGILYLIGVCVFLPCSIATLVAAAEKPFVPTPEEIAKEKPRGVGHVVAAIRIFPPMFYWLVFTQFIAQLGAWPISTYVSNWMGENVFGGDPDAPEGSAAYNDYQDGVHAGSLSQSVMSVVMIVTSFVLPVLTPYFGVKPLYAAGQIVAGLGLIACGWVTTEWTAMFCIALSGIPWAMNGVYPSIILCNYVPVKNRGSAVSLLYVISVVSQFLVSSAFGYAVKLDNNNVSAALVLGGIFSVAVGPLIIPLRASTRDDASA